MLFIRTTAALVCYVRNADSPFSGCGGKGMLPLYVAEMNR